MLHKRDKEESRSTDAVDVRYGECRRRIHHYVSKRYPDLDADDIAQETLVCFLTRQCHVDTNQSYIILLFKIADDTARDTRLRRKSEFDALPRLLAPTDVESAEDRALLNWERAALHEGLNLLGSSDRQIVILRHCRELSVRVIAELLHTTYTAARQRMSRAERRLVENLKRVGLTLAAAPWIVDILRQACRIMVGGPVAGSLVALTVGIGTAIVEPQGEFDADMIGARPRNPAASSGILPAIRNQRSGNPVNSDLTSPSAPKALPTPPLQELTGAPVLRAEYYHSAQIAYPLGPGATLGQRLVTGPKFIDPLCTPAVVICTQADDPTTRDIGSSRQTRSRKTADAVHTWQAKRISGHDQGPGT